MHPVLVYGASGYSGRLVARELCRLGVRPLLCGRDGRKVAAVADELGLPHRVAAVDDPAALAAAVAEAPVVLNAAGPFSHTTAPLVAACLARGAHYLDIAGEVPAVAALAARHAEARARGVMLLPSVGFDVVPTDCLLAYVARRCPGGRALVTAVSKPLFLSPGSAKTLLEHVDLGVARRQGVVTPLRLGAIERAFDFGDGARSCLNVSFVDVVTAYYTTGIGDVTTFVEATPLLRLLPLGLILAPWIRSPFGELVGQTRLRDEAVGPRLRRALLRFLQHVAGEHQDGNVAGAVVRLQFDDRIPAGHPGQARVHQDEVGGAFHGQLDRLDGRRRDDDVEALEFEVRRVHLARVREVVHQEDAGALHEYG